MDDIKEFHKQDLGVVPFGMYKGKRWSEVPADYLKWIVSDEFTESMASGMPGIKDIARKELAQRNVLEGQLEMF